MLDLGRFGREKKCWGSVAHIFSNHDVAISHLLLVAGTRSSKHYHQHRANKFCIISGKIVVDVFPASLTLNAGESLIVPSMVIHRFRVVEDAEVVEVYWADRGGVVALDDIVRLDEGGIDEKQ